MSLMSKEYYEKQDAKFLLRELVSLKQKRHEYNEIINFIENLIDEKTILTSEKCVGEFCGKVAGMQDVHTESSL